MTTPTESTDLSPASRRTRSHIVDTAVVSLAENRHASLGDIADAAGVSRSTLHRHFADRAELLTAIDAECRQRFTIAMTRADIDRGTGMEVLNRLALEFLDLGPVLSLIFADDPLVDPDSWGNPGGMAALIERGQREHSIDPELPAPWVETTLWMLLLGAWVSLSGGSVNRHEVPGLLTRTLSGAFAPR